MCEDTLKNVLNHLDETFKILNDKFYNGGLPKPIFTIIPDKKNLGYCTSDKVWIDDKNAEHQLYEINLSSEYLNRPKDEIVETLLHEMVHLYCNVNSIRDCAGKYHNKKYKQYAEEHGLICEKTKYGYSKTDLSFETKEWIQTLELPKFDLFRKTQSGSKSKQIVYRYVCPVCGAIARSTKPLNLYCGDCECEMIRTEY